MDGNNLGVIAVNSFVTRMCALLGDEDGASAVEYVVIASVLGLALVPVLSDTSNSVAGLFQRVNGYFAGLM